MPEVPTQTCSARAWAPAQGSGAQFVKAAARATPEPLRCSAAAHLRMDNLKPGTTKTWPFVPLCFSTKLIRGSQRGASWEFQVTLERSNPDAWLNVAVQVLSAAAVAEFKLGSAERGRAIFEDVLRNYPKRTDLWSVYLDQVRALPKGPVLSVLISSPAPPRNLSSCMTVELFRSSRQTLRHNTT